MANPEFELLIALAGLAMFVTCLWVAQRQPN
jgi:hypothetical protein